MGSTDDLVEAFVRKVLAHPEAGASELAAGLAASDIDPETAECLIAFVPMAFAHVILGDLGVRLPSAFVLRDAVTGKTARGLLRDEPIFQRACARARSMLASGPDAQHAATTIASASSEWEVIAHLTRNGSDPSSCGLTEAVLMRLSPDYLIEPKPRQSWWKFW